MHWRSVALGALVILLGVGAAFCVATEIRLNTDISLVYSNSGTAMTPIQIDEITALSHQLSTAHHLDFPLVAGSLVSAVALLVVLAWGWQVRGRG